MIEVSELSIEEISHRIIRVVERRRAGAAANVKPKPTVPLWRWGVWYAILGARALRLLRRSSRRSGSALRSLAWLAEFRRDAAAAVERRRRFAVP